MPRKYEILSPRHRGVEFPDDWYEFAGDSHFWMRWRLRAFLRQLRDLRLPLKERWRGLEVGCGDGGLRNQISRRTCWEIDGAEINTVALERDVSMTGTSYLYDIFDRREDMRKKYDFLVLFDVLEHIDDEAGFLEASLFHLKTGGWVFVNVPALEGLRSVYDEVAGHLRRYSPRSVRGSLAKRNLEVRDVRFWGCSLVPLLVVRKGFLMGVSREKVIRRGFEPPSRWVHAALQGLMRVETGLSSRPPIGTSLLAAAVKP